MDPRVQAYLSSLDLDLSEGEALFKLLQNGPWVGWDLRWLVGSSKSKMGRRSLRAWLVLFVYFAGRMWTSIEFLRPKPTTISNEADHHQ